MNDLSNVLGSMRSARDLERERAQAFAEKQAADEANFSEENRPDILGGLVKGGLGLMTGNPLAAVGGLASGLMNKKAVNKRGGSVQGPQDNSLMELLMKLQGMGGFGGNNVSAPSSMA
jgi:hypothetical protein